ncbi:MAG: hypothetical protein PVH19_06145 [Planctomycetia bacterium]
MYRFFIVRWVLIVGLCFFATGRLVAEEAEPEAKPLRVAVFPIGATSNVEVDPDALTDQMNVLLSMLPEVTLIDRADLKKAAEEQKMALSGMVDANSAVKLGKMLNAQYILVGRASKIGKTHYMVLRLIEVETTKQTTISAKAPVSKGMEEVLEKLGESLSEKIGSLKPTSTDNEQEAKIKALKKLLKPFGGKRFLVQVSEEHVNREIKDPAAQMAATHLLTELGIEFVVPKDPPRNWKENLLESGTYGDQKIDYLLEGDGVSEFAGRVQGLISCRARVELRLIKLPGRNIMAIDKGVAAGVDLTEALASKSALEKAGLFATEAMLRRAVKKLEKKEEKEKEE